MAKNLRWEELWSPLEIKGVKFKNRMMRSGTYEGMATEQGKVTPQLEWWIARQAAGGAACIFPGYLHVCLLRSHLWRSASPAPARPADDSPATRNRLRQPVRIQYNKRSGIGVVPNKPIDGLVTV